MSVFHSIDRVRYEGDDSRLAIAFRRYDSNRVLLVKCMSERSASRFVTGIPLVRPAPARTALPSLTPRTHGMRA